MCPATEHIGLSLSLMPGSGPRASRSDRLAVALGSEGVVALCRNGAYLVATTLAVVSCLHRHASLDSMREVETFQPQVFEHPADFRQESLWYAVYNNEPTKSYPAPSGPLRSHS